MWLVVTTFCLKSLGLGVRFLPCVRSLHVFTVLRGFPPCTPVSTLTTKTCYIDWLASLNVSVMCACASSMVCPEPPGIGCRLPTTLCRINSTENEWMNGNLHTTPISVVWSLARFHVCVFHIFFFYPCGFPPCSPVSSYSPVGGFVTVNLP